MLNLIKVDYLINDTKPDWGFEPSSRAIFGFIFMILH